MAQDSLSGRWQRLPQWTGRRRLAPVQGLELARASVFRFMGRGLDEGVRGEVVRYTVFGVRGAGCKVCSVKCEM